MNLFHPNSSVIQSHLLQLTLLILLWPPQEIPSWGCTLESYSFTSYFMMKQSFSQNKTKSHLFGEYRCATVSWIWAISGLAVPDSRNEKSWPHLWIQWDGTGATVWMERGFVAHLLCHGRTVPKISQNQITLSNCGINKICQVSS